MGYWLDAFNPNVPTTYTEALSYLEQLERNYKLLLEAICQLNGIREEVKKEVEKWAEELRGEMKNEIYVCGEMLRADMIEQNAAWYNALKNHKEDIEEDIRIINARISSMQVISDDRFRNILFRLEQMGFEVNEDLNAMNKELIKIKKDILDLSMQFTDFKFHIQAQVDNQIKEMINLIESQLEKINGDIIIVTNPLSGERDTLKNTLEQIAEWKTPIPIRFCDYNKLKMPYGEYNAMEITFRDYDNFAGLIFWKRLHIGIWDDRFAALEERLERLENEKWRDLIEMGENPPEIAYRNLADTLFQLSASPITCLEYTNANITYEEYENLNTTALQYALYGVSGRNMWNVVNKNENDISILSEESIVMQADIEKLKTYHEN